MTISSKVKQTLAGLKSARAVLMVYEAQSRDEETWQVYREALDATDGIVKDLEHRVQELEYQEPQYKGL